MNTVLAVLGVIVVAVIVIALSIWLGKSRKRDLDRAMGKVAPDNKKTRDAKAAADARLAAGKGLAFPRETLCAPVSTLEALAAAYTGEGTVLCALDARRAQVYSAAFDLATHQRLLEDDARAVADLAQFVENCKKPLFFVGDGASLCYNKYGSVPGVLETPPALRGGRAAAVALVAKQMAEAGQAVMPEALLPDYHRLSQAERERAERLAAEAAAKA